MGFYYDEDYNDKCIPVIASFDGKGNFKPELCRINGEAWKVVSCRVKSEDRLHTLYWVKLLFENSVIETQLIYYANNNLWQLIKGIL